MKKLVILSFFLWVGLTQQGSAQNKSCCSLKSANDFAMLGNDPSFLAAHLPPVNFHFVAAKGVDITFPVADGKEGRGFLVKSATLSNKYLFVFHEWWGLNDHIRKEAEKLSDDFPGVNVLAIDLYDGNTATNATDAAKMMESNQKDRSVSIIKGAYLYAGNNASVQTIGWCFGGAWSLQAAIIGESKTAGCVMYYGTPETDAARLSKLQAPVLGLFALRDNWINKPMVEKFQNQMKELNKSVTVHWFDADHAFANPSNPKFDEAATAQANKLARAFIQRNWEMRDK
jgi:carboxymethylenebutenolidase